VYYIGALRYIRMLENLRTHHSYPPAVYSVKWIGKTSWLYASTNNKNLSWMGKKIVEKMESIKKRRDM